MMNIDFVIKIVEIFIFLYPLIASVIQYKEFTRALEIFSGYILFAVIIEWTGHYLGFLGKNNLFLAHIYVVGIVAILSLYYGSIMKEFIHRKWIITIIISFAILTVLNAIYLQPLSTFPIYMIILSSIIILTLIFLSMYERSKRAMPKITINAMNYERNRISYFFINTGLIIFHVAAVPVLICVDLALKRHYNGLAIDMWTIYRCLLIIMQIFIGTGLLKFKRIKPYIDPEG